MTFLPIVDRELRIASRKQSTFWIRTLAACALAAVAGVMLVFGVLSSFQLQTGRAMYRTLSFLIVLYCVTEGIRKTSDCLSEEKREGTLGLLFLTSLNGYDIVLGKLAARSLTSIYGLLAMLPILSLSVMLGGVTSGEFWRMALALANLLFFCLCAGVFVSARSTKESRALAGTIALITCCIVAPELFPATGLAQASPLRPWMVAHELAYNASPSGFWRPLLGAHALSWLLLAWASWTVRRSWTEKSPGRAGIIIRNWRSRADFGSPARRRRLRAELLDINPVLWLASRSVFCGRRWPWYAVWLWVIACLVVHIKFSKEEETGLAILALLFNFIVKMQYGAEACRCFAEIRRNNATEMLLCTPLDARQIIRGQMLALKRLFLAPLIALFSLELVSMIALWTASANTGLVPFRIFLLLLIPIYLGLFALDIFALTWTGMWFGLTSKNETRAIINTVGIIVLASLPCFLFGMFCGLSLPLVLLIPILGIVIPREKLLNEFRSIAVKGYSPIFESAASTRVQPSGPPPLLARP